MKKFIFGFVAGIVALIAGNIGLMKKSEGYCTACVQGWRAFFGYLVFGEPSRYSVKPNPTHPSYKSYCKGGRDRYEKEIS